MSDFTPFELDILECLASRYTLDEIADDLGKTPHTMIRFVTRVRRKMGFPYSGPMPPITELWEKALAMFCKTNMYILKQDTL